MNTSAEFHEHIWTTCALLVLECNSDENIGFQIDLIRDIQELASNPVQNIRLSYASRYPAMPLLRIHLKEMILLFLEVLTDHMEALSDLQSRLAFSAFKAVYRIRK